MAYDAGYGHGPAPVGYQSTFGGNALADEIPGGSNYIDVSKDLGYDAGYGEIYYHGYASRSPADAYFDGHQLNSYYYSVTRYSTDGNYYLHNTGYLSAPSDTLTENYSRFLYANGYTSTFSSHFYAHSVGGTDYDATYKTYHSYNANGSSYTAELNSYTYSNASGAHGPYNTFDAVYTNPEGYSYYNSARG